MVLFCGGFKLFLQCKYNFPLDIHGPIQIKLKVGVLSVFLDPYLNTMFKILGPLHINKKLLLQGPCKVAHSAHPLYRRLVRITKVGN